jgi:hypothetical protein
VKLYTITTCNDGEIITTVHVGDRTPRSWAEGMFDLDSESERRLHDEIDFDTIDLDQLGQKVAEATGLHVSLDEHDIEESS